MHNYQSNAKITGWNGRIYFFSYRTQWMICDLFSLNWSTVWRNGSYALHDKRTIRGKNHRILTTQRLWGPDKFKTTVKEQIPYIYLVSATSQSNLHCWPYSVISKFFFYIKTSLTFLPLTSARPSCIFYSNTGVAKPAWTLFPQILTSFLHLKPGSILHQYSLICHVFKTPYYSSRLLLRVF